MSSKMNHKRRYRYSEHNKGGAFRAAARKAYYRDGVDTHNRGALGLLARMFRGRTPQKNAAETPAAK